MPSFTYVVVRARGSLCLFQDKKCRCGRGEGGNLGLKCMRGKKLMHEWRRMGGDPRLGVKLWHERGSAMATS